MFKLVDIRSVLGDDCRFGPGSDCAVLCQKSGIASHDLDEKDAIVRCGRVADFVHAFDDRIQRRILSDRDIRPAEIIVDRPRKPDAGQVVLFGEDACAA